MHKPNLFIVVNNFYILKKSLFAVATMLVLLFVFDCTQVSVCGNGICELTENNTYSVDCPSGVPDTQAKVIWKAASLVK